MATGTKYRVNMQAKTGEQFSKVTKVSASTSKYAAPKGKVNKQASAGAGVGSVVFELSKASATSLASSFNGTATGYEIGMYVGKQWLFGSALVGYMAKEGIRFEGAGIMVSTTGVMFTGVGQVTVKGLASQKYTFGLRETAMVDGTETESAIRKITAAPAKYNAPKVTKPTTGATTLTWTPVRTATEGQTIVYVVGMYDNKAKEFKTDPAIIETAEHVAVDISELGLGKIGVQEVLKDTVTGDVIAKSAIRVVTVR